MFWIPCKVQWSWARVDIDRPSRHCQPVLEPLEQRVLLATIPVTIFEDIVDPADDAQGVISLREAINLANLNSSDADLIELRSGTYHIEIDGIFDDDNALGDFDIAGPLTIRGRGRDETTINGHDLDRVFHVVGTPTPFTVAFERLTIRDGSTEADGGGILVENSNAPGPSTLTVSNCRIISNVAEQSGGGIAAFRSILEVTNSEIGKRDESNRAGVSGGGIAIFEGRAFLRNSVVGSNDAGDGPISDAQGGGIFAYGDHLRVERRSEISLVNTKVRENDVFGSGGGIGVLDAVSLTLDNSSVFRNESIDDGGGIAASESTDFIHGEGVITLVNGSVVHDNLADEQGGGIFNVGGDVALTDSIVRNNQSGGGGGGIFSRSGDVTLTNSSVRDNGFSLDGGGVRTLAGDVTLDNSSIRNNRTRQEGGGIRTDTGNVLLQNGSDVSDNHAEGSGGGIFSEGGPIELQDSTVRGNRADQFGGGIVARGGTVTLSDSEVHDNTAENGDGGGVHSLSSVILSNSRIHHNKAKGDGDGGGIWNDRGNVSVHDRSEVDNNTAGGDGGGIYSNGGSVGVSGLGSAVSSNDAEANGGGIFVESGAVSVLGGTVRDNKAGLDGGGVCIRDGQIIFNAQGLIEDNHADRDGGGIFAGSVFAEITISTIQDNEAGRDGGGMFTNGTLLFDRSTFHNNNALLDGGGIFAHDASLVVRESTLSNNTAQRGGGIFIEQSSFAHVINSTISGNTARFRRRGGDVRAGVIGGGLLFDIQEQGIANLTNVTITDNRARGGSLIDASGGGVAVLAGIVHVKNTLIAKNFSGDSAPDVRGTFVSLGHNLIGVGDGSAGFGILEDLVGTADSPLNPRLAPLADNGGPTKTHALLADSPAIDAGDNTDAPLRDQRLFLRLREPDDIVDIGAFEFGAFRGEPPNPDP